jgi:uncharacterized heparinase superfamily protein
MSALSASVVIGGEVGTSVDRHDSWDGHVIITVHDGYQTPLRLYIAEDKARALIEQLTEALAAQAVGS